MTKDKNEKSEEELAAEAELQGLLDADGKELDALLQEHQENKNPPDDRQTSLKLIDAEYDRLIAAISERNRLSDLIADIICKGYRELSK